MPPEHYEDVRYDLMRATYDVKTDTWGEPETVLASAETGQSILLPRVSPDGRFLLFCMCKYGCFPIYQPSSDLYLMDLETRKYERLHLNSDQSESWHSWSSNGRWFAFSSKRNDGIFTRTYLSYFDASGKAHKPVIVPQKSPTFYDSHLKTFSLPELVVEPVQVSSWQLVQAVCSPRQEKLAMPDISMTRKRPKPSPWRPGPTAERE
jgi:dipeptidyl aminopeptidase/acylaminoacyl peptidase